MIDKVQKIREEVLRLQNELIQEKEKGYGSDVDDACILELQNVLTYIDSLQEEPVSEVWHDVTEKPNTKRFVVLTKDGMIATAFIPPKMSFGELVERSRIKKWAYLDDLVNLSNVQRTTKNLKKPVSEDLEKAARDYSNNLDNIRGSIGEMVRNAYKAGAKWKKDKMIRNAVDAQCFGFQGAALFSFRLPADNYLVGSEVKVIVVKED